MVLYVSQVCNLALESFVTRLAMAVVPSSHHCWFSLGNKSHTAESHTYIYIFLARLTIQTG